MEHKPSHATSQDDPAAERYARGPIDPSIGADNKPLNLSPKEDEGGYRENDGNSASGVSDPELNRWTRALVCWTAALVFTAIGSDLFQGLQWVEIKNADVESSRAWVGPRNLSSGQPVQGQPLDIILEYTNSGRTPAINFTAGFDAEVTDIDDKDNLAGATTQATKWASDCRSSAASDIGNIAFPTSGFVNYNYTYTIPIDKMTDVVDRKNSMIVALGCFVYRSAETVHHTSFCFLFKHGITKPANWNICPGGTFAD